MLNTKIKYEFLPILFENSYNIIIFATNQGGVYYDTGIQDEEL